VTARALVAGAVAALVVAVPAAAVLGAPPQIVRVSALRAHVLVTARFDRSELPYRVEVSTSPRLGAAGFPARFVADAEWLPSAGTGLVRYRTKRSLAPGRYWVAVSGRIAGVGTCFPLHGGGPCNVVWSRPVPLRVG